MSALTTRPKSNRVRPSEMLALDTRSVHLWTANVRTFRPVLRRFMTLLSPEERKRAARLADPVHRMDFTLAHGFLRLVLSRYLSIRPERLRFQSHANGKPRLAEGADLSRFEFNLAHSGHMAMIAVASGRPVGVDVEALRRPVRAQAIVERYFAPAERAHFASLSRSRQESEFIRYWTAKEAVLKATGVGLAGGLSRYEVIGHPGGRSATVRLQGDDKARSWLVRFVPLSTEYLGAVAAEGVEWRVRRYQSTLRVIRGWLDERE